MVPSNARQESSVQHSNPGGLGRGDHLFVAAQHNRRGGTQAAKTGVDPSLRRRDHLFVAAVSLQCTLQCTHLLSSLPHRTIFGEEGEKCDDHPQGDHLVVAAQRNRRDGMQVEKTGLIHLYGAVSVSVIIPRRPSSSRSTTSTSSSSPPRSAGRRHRWVTPSGPDGVPICNNTALTHPGRAPAADRQPYGRLRCLANCRRHVSCLCLLPDASTAAAAVAARTSS